MSMASRLEQEAEGECDMEEREDWAFMDCHVDDEGGNCGRGTACAKSKLKALEYSCMLG